MALVNDDDMPDADLDGEPQLGEVPAGLGADLYAKRLDSLSKDEAFDDGVLSFPDADGVEREILLEDVEATEHDHHSNRTKIILRSGAAVVVSGAVIAGAVAAIRYRRKHKS
jgi:hypothetical protein